MSNILVTGCAGFIGSSLCEMLLETSENDNIIGVDNFDTFYSKKTKKKYMNFMSVICEMQM